MKKVSLGSRDNWSAMKYMTYKDLKGPNGMSTKVASTVDRLAREYTRDLGREANFREGEKLINWVGRVARKKVLG